MEKNNFKYIFVSHRSQIVSGIVMISAGLLTGAAAERRTLFFPQPAADTAVVALLSTPSEATPAEAAVATLFNATMAEATPAEPLPVLRPDRLNLAFITADGEEGGPGTGSMAQLLYELLASREAAWTSEIYDLYNQKPVALGAKTGIGPEALLGAYNYQDPAQNPQDPATWVVPEFKSIHVTFLDGSGQAGAGESNLKEIIAMASVYNYYGNAGTLEELKDYALSLWEASHSYSFQISPVYYCEGCLEENGTGAEGGSADSGDAGEALSGDVSQGPGAAAAADGADDTLAGPAADGTEAGAGGTTAGTDGTVAGAGGTVAGTDETAAGTDETAAGVGGTTGTAVDGTAVADGTNDTGTGLSEEAAKIVVEGIDGGPGVSAPLQNENQEETSAELPVMCPGHVDLAIQVTMAGTNGDGSLFARDARGAAALTTEESGWPGWNEETMGYVRSLCGQDWFEEYGLTVENLVVRNPLTAVDIDLYMRMLPLNASKERKDLVRFALTSVGRVPYYWGGKPGAPGYEPNRFGIVVSPDEDGRFLKGLDCSGWVSWVYWSATGSRLAGESTSNQIHCGRAVSKGELQPGDVCIRLGSRAHIVMFLGWTDDGQMLCIQETSGNINNVEVGICAADWPYYRRLVD